MYINESVLAPSRNHRHSKRSENLKIEAKLNKLEGQSSVKQKTCNQTAGSKSSESRGNYLDALSSSYQQQELDEQDKNNYSQSKFQQILMWRIEKTLDQCQITLEYLDSRQQQFKQPESQKDRKAYEQCCRLLQEESSEQQSAHLAAINLITKKMLIVDDYKFRLRKQIQDIKAEIESDQQQNEQLSKEWRMLAKKRSDRGTESEKIASQANEISKLNQKLQNCQERSHQQREDYIDLQSEEFRYLSMLKSQEQEIQRIEQEAELNRRHHELTAYRQKVLQLKETVETEVAPHLQRKIEKMAQLRADLVNIDGMLSELDTEIEDQNYIMGALKAKVYSRDFENPRSSADSLVSRYRKKYQSVLMGEKEGGEEWTDYKNYIMGLMSRNQQSMRQINDSDLKLRRKQLSVNVHSHSDCRYASQAPANSGKTQYRFQKKPQIHPSLDSSSAHYLPKITTNNNKPNFKSKLIEQLKKKQYKSSNLDRVEDIELESVDSDESSSKISGEVIEVDFHKK